MKKTGRPFLFISLSFTGLIFVLGFWWLYLLYQFGEKLATVEEGLKIATMLKWEGATFLFLLILLAASLIFLYYKDQKKTKSLQSFFAGMTHELKTPLASIRLQGEVLADLSDQLEEDRLDQLTSRLLQDTNKLETQLDKILQLSRIEGGGNLNPTSIDLFDFIERIKKRWPHPEEITLKMDLDSPVVFADEFALELIIRNLFENTLQHSKKSEALIEIKKKGLQIQMDYSGPGDFSGDIKKLGTLFYKHKSPRGSGIGLYLISKLAKGMQGDFLIQTNPHLSFSLLLPQDEAL